MNNTDLSKETIDDLIRKAYNKAIEDVEMILLKKFKFAGMPLIKEIKELKKKEQGK